MELFHQGIIRLLCMATYVSFTFTTVIKEDRACIGVLGARFNKGQRKEGVEDGPSVIRETGFMQQLTNAGFIVKDYGDLFSGEDSDYGYNGYTGPNGEQKLF
ncbi:unnamed protein product [Meganyctiphanes norvegica]|uniref:Uncharacterized protein n=1 Tax=Meganyctiphanes norvegica TaxID=48144 RepID=A0AAV2QHL8_MEGNR